MSESKSQMTAKIAARLGISSAQVWKLSTQGMPTDSVEAAIAWRVSRPAKRARTTGTTKKFVAGIPSAPSVPNFVPPPPLKQDRVMLTPPTPTGDSLLDSLNQSVYVANEAFRMVAEAMAADNADQLQIKLSIHTHAQQAANKAQEAYRVEQEKRGQLISLTVAKQRFRKGFDFLLKRFRSLPQSKSPELNPDNPVLAFTILDGAINQIISDAQDQYLPKGEVPEEADQVSANLHSLPKKKIRRKPLTPKKPKK